MHRSLSGALILVGALALLVPACNSSDPVAGTFLAGASTAQGGGALDQWVSLTFTPTGGGTAVTANTDTSGNFSVSLAAGMWDILATRPGYQDYTATSVDVVDAQTTVHDFSMTPLPPNTYLRSTTCAVCHPTQFADERQTGHPFKLNKVENNQAPTYPFSDISASLAMIDDEDGVTDNTLGTPATWNDVSYVIGGFFWKSRYMDDDGFIVTGTEVQYNLATQAMAAYHDGDVDKPYNCGNCHTTGWRHEDGTLNPNRQDNRPGIDGTWAEPGIQCESCHGAGSTHAQTKLAADITQTASARTTAQLAAADQGYGLPVHCGECHTRDGEKDYPTYISAYTTAGGPEPLGGRIEASGGLVRHHEQYDELLGVDPDAIGAGSTRSTGFRNNHLDCMTCHDPHGSTVYQDDAAYTGPPGVKKANADCMVCHSNRDPNLRTGGMKSLNCIDCHMPKMAKSAVSTTLSNGVVVGDVTSHIFRIDVTKDPATEQFVTVGTKDYSKPYITGDWACRTCHGNGGLFDVSFPSTFVFHNNIP